MYPISRNLAEAVQETPIRETRGSSRGRDTWLIIRQDFPWSSSAVPYKFRDSTSN
jgi:hypothetical protein